MHNEIVDVIIKMFSLNFFCIHIILQNKKSKI